jgi:hypothetical protein
MERTGRCTAFERAGNRSADTVTPSHAIALGSGDNERVQPQLMSSTVNTQPFDALTGDPSGKTLRPKPGAGTSAQLIRNRSVE